MSQVDREHEPRSCDAVPKVRIENLEVRKGEVTSLMGRNGVGKTTLLRAIAG
ncbi:MAG: ATP-binding cassette domain-containing protein, partial [Myxococcales bacterium]|nr:ATP-binding cassette domain-containing protein [Myxococcales bacterium]